MAESFMQTVARLLLAAPRPHVDRAWLRARVPSGDSVPRGQPARQRRMARGAGGSRSQGLRGSQNLANALRCFEKSGLVRRAGVTHVQVLDRPALAAVREFDNGREIRDWLIARYAANHRALGPAQHEEVDGA